MFYQYTILEVNGENVLYLYVDPHFEFSKDFTGDDRKRSIYDRVINYIRNQGIPFEGRKIYLVINGIVVGQLQIKKDMEIASSNEEPLYQTVEFFTNSYPHENIEILNLEEAQEVPVHAGKLIDLERSSGVMERVWLEDYVLGVVTSDMPFGYQKEAMKARAVLARTYAKREIEQGRPLKEIDTLQIYRDADSARELWKDDYEQLSTRVLEVVHDTLGEVLTYHDTLVLPFTHLANQGKTENAKDILFEKIPYLVSVPSPEKDEDRPPAVPVFYSFERISDILNQPIDRSSPLQVIKYTEGGRILQIQLGKFRYRGDYLAKRLGFFSNSFTFEKQETGILFTVHLEDEGLGMSLRGANQMAKNGANYLQILAHYFPGTEVKNAEKK